MNVMRSPAGSYRSLGNRVAFLAVALVAALAAARCNPTESDWRNAQKANTVDAYQQFMAKHPQAGQVGEAKLAVESIEWETAKRQNSIEAYDVYLAKHKDGRFVSEARAASEGLAWEEAKSTNRPTAYLAYFLAHRDSAQLVVGPGTVTSAIAYPMGGGLVLQAKGASERAQDVAGPEGASPLLWIEVDGVRVDMSPEEAGKLGIIIFENGIIATRSGSMTATIVRDKATGKILTIDTTGKP